MNQTLQLHCRNFVRAQRNIARAEPLQNMYARPICSELFAEHEMEPDVLRLKKCESFLIKEEGFFSDFSGISALMIVTALALSDDPKQKLKDLQQARVIIRRHFPPVPDYIPLACIILSDEKDDTLWEPMAQKASIIYETLKEKNRILNSGGDILFSLLIAKSGKDTQKVIQDTKACVQYLKPETCIDPQSFHCLCRVLAMNGSDAESSCQRYHDLYNYLKEKGYRYGRGYQSPMLALAALLPQDIEDIGKDIIDVDTYLSRHEMYRGLVPKYSKTVRLMHSAMIVAGASRPKLSRESGTDGSDVIIAMEITLWALFGMLFL